MTDARWVVVVPVKGGPFAKSRLAADAALARAIALDTIEAVAAARSVWEVVVATADRGFATDAAALPGVRVALEEESAGIAAAVRAGLGTVSDELPRAVALADLPALRPADLDAALALAASVDRGFVPDAEGTGTVLVTALPGLAFRESFGDCSAERHRQLGLAELGVPASSTLRRDVDTRAQLAAATTLGLGPRTAALLHDPHAFSAP